MDLNQDQKKAYEAILSGQNIFVTGPERSRKILSYSKGS